MIGHAVATNFQYGNLTAFSQGDLINPIAASAYLYQEGKKAAKKAIPKILQILK